MKQLEADKLERAAKGPVTTGVKEWTAPWATAAFRRRKTPGVAVPREDKRALRFFSRDDVKTQSEEEERERERERDIVLAEEDFILLNVTPRAENFRFKIRTRREI